MAEQRPMEFTVDMLPEINLRTFRPKGNRLLIKPIVVTEVKIGSVHIGDNQREQMKKMLINKGEVVSVGTDIQDKTIMPGSIVYFFRGNSGGGLRVGSEEYLLFCEYDILADIDPSPLLSITPTAQA